MAYSELVRLTERTAYLPSASNVGVIHTPIGLVLVDAGNDAEAGRRILKTLTAAGKSPAAILLTHSNADHIGGAAFIADRTGAPLYASAMEAAFCAHPSLEPAFLWGGLPPRELRNKFFIAKACAVKTIGPGSLETLWRCGEADGAQSVSAQIDVEAIPLPGHFFGQLGFLADGVLFAGDSLFGAEAIAKHPLFFIYDPEAFFASLDLIQAKNAALVLPSHGKPTEDVSGLVAVNRTAAERMASAVRDACAVPASAEDVLARLRLRFAIDLGWAQYALVGSTIRSFLVYLRERGELTADFLEGRLVWRKA